VAYIRGERQQSDTLVSLHSDKTKKTDVPRNGRATLWRDLILPTGSPLEPAVNLREDLSVAGLPDSHCMSLNA